MKKIITSIIVAFCLLHAHYCFSQAPDIEWENTIWSNQADELASIQPTPDGGYILAGDTFSGAFPNGDKSESGQGRTDIWIVKTDASGNIEWDEVIGGSDYDIATGVIPTGDGNYLFGGYSFSPVSGDKTAPNKGLYDYWVIKLNSTGGILWQKTYGGSHYDYLRSLEMTADGGFILGGESYSNISGDKTENTYGLQDCWVIKADADGNMEWQNSFGGSGVEYTEAVHQTMDGGYIVGVSSSSDAAGDKTEALGDADYWIVKLDASGNIVWEETMGGVDRDYIGEIKQTTDGGFIIGGYSESDISADKSENNLSGYDYWVVKINATGTIQWEETIQGNSSDQLYDILEVPGGYFLAGTSSSGISGDKTENNLGADDYWIMMIDGSANVFWQKTIGGTAEDDVCNAVLANDGSFVIGGTSASPVSIFKSEGTHQTDFWIVKLFPGVCGVPAGLFADNITTTKATIHWNHVPGFATYQLWYRPVGAGTWVKKSALTNNKVIKSLLPNTTYEYKLRTQCSDGEFSEFSTTENFTTLSLRTGEMENNLVVDLYPNPASDMLYINIENAAGDAGLEIFDMTGNRISDFDFSKTSELISIDIAHLPKGMYLLYISDTIQTRVIKFIHQ